MASESEDLKYLQRNVKELSEESASKDWASKKMIWIPDPTEGFVAASVTNAEGEQIEVMLTSGQHQTVAKSDVHKMNPPKFDKVEDMAELTCLNEASVLYNIRSRYNSGLIYTYSGLFCVVINPYRNVPIYTDQIITLYSGKRKNELPPHVFAVASLAYRKIIEEKENQSILCTGESGAGKTENTKKIIRYLAHIAARGDSTSGEDINLRLLQTNPILEAFGNAKTVKNDNSSRFGKFIKINFSISGTISSVSIVTYLLEKSRIVRQAQDERSFHIFYQILSRGFPAALKAEFMVEDVAEYPFLTNSGIGIAGLDDSATFEETDTAFKIIGFSEEVIKNIYQILAGILNFGKMTFGSERKTDQATLPDNSYAQKLCHLLGLQVGTFTQAVLVPRIKVGSDVVQRAQTKDQAIFSVESIAKSTYERLFGHIVATLNKHLGRSKGGQENFIGILDIAGFEIFKVNGFEQLCINFTNEKLQQLFNHSMFILEQEEYRKEGIQWDYIDFGLDLQPTIDLMEKPTGIMPLIDEECVFPKATARSLVEKIIAQNKNNPKLLAASKVSDGTEFGVVHYAGKVFYSAGDWLLKNTDPLNENVASVMAASSNPLVAEIWREGHSGPEDSRKKRGMMRTHIHLYKGQLAGLINTLYETNVHFVRCIIPNLQKRSGQLDPHLVLEQLRCNGVLEGIRICRQGFPNRVQYLDFVQRYSLLVPQPEVDRFMDSRKTTQNMLAELELDPSLYRMGHTKIFFRAGVLANFEEERDMKLSRIMVHLITRCRMFLSRRHLAKKQAKVPSILTIQHNCKNYIVLRSWPWFWLYSRILPLVDIKKEDDEKKQREDEIKALREKNAKLMAEVEEMKKLIEKMEEEISAKSQKISSEVERSDDLEQEIVEMTKKKKEIEGLVDDLNEEMQEMESSIKRVSGEKNDLRATLAESEKILKEQEEKHSRLMQDKTGLEHKLQQRSDELSDKNHLIENLQKEKRAAETNLAEMEKSLHCEEDQTKKMQKTIKKLEANVEEMQEQLQKEISDNAAFSKMERKSGNEINELRAKVEEQTTNIQQLTQQVSSKTEQLAEATARYEEETMGKDKLGKEIRELKFRLEEAREELEVEAESRKNLDKVRRDLLTEIEAMKLQEEEAADLNEAERNLVREKDTRIAALQRELEEAVAASEEAMKSQRKQANEVVTQITNELEAVKKSESTLVKKLKASETEREEMGEENKMMARSKQEGDKKRKQLEQQILEMGQRNTELEKAASDLGDQVGKCNTQNAKLTETADKLERHNTELERKLKSATDHLEEVKSKLGDEMEALSKANSQINKMEMTISELNDHVEEETSKAEGHFRQVMQLQSKCNEALKGAAMVAEEKEMVEDSVRRLQKEMENLKTENDILTAAKQKAEKSSSMYQHELEDANAQIESTELTLSNMEKKQKKFDSAMSEVKAANAGLAKEKDSLEQEIRSMESRCLSMNRAVEEKSKDLQEMTKKNATLTSELAEVKSTVSGEAADNVSMKAQIREYKKRNEEMSSQLEELQDEVYGIQKELDRKEVAFQAERMEFSRKLADLTEESEEMARSTNKKIGELRDELEDERKAKTGALTAKKKMEHELKDNLDKIISLEETVEELTKQTKKHHASYKEAQKELELVRTNASSASESNSQLQAKLQSSLNASKELTEQISHLEHLTKSLTTERDQISEQVQISADKLSQSNSEMVQLKRAIANIKEDLEEEKTNHEDLEEELRKSNILRDQTMSELSSLKLSLEKAGKQVSSAEKKNHELTSRLESIEEEVERARSAKDSAESKLRKLSAMEAELDDEIKRRQELEKKLKMANKKSKEGQSMVDMLQGEVDRMKSDHGTLMGRIKNYKKNNDELEDEISTAKNKLRKLTSEKDDLEMERNDLLAEVSRLKSSRLRAK